MKETAQILRMNGFTKNPNTLFSSASGRFMPDIERWYNQLTKPKENSVIGRYEGINPTEAGFELILSHGRLGEPSILRFPRFGTEPDFRGAFDRLMKFIKANYDYEPGLPAFLHGD